MRRILKGLFYFLPVQLLLLHFRKYQLLLLFWVLLLLLITGNLAEHFGASYLFLAPEYLGNVSFTSMFLLGSAVCVFTMMWHITTFIIHSRRIEYLSITRHSFLVYCLNNSIIPMLFFMLYSVVSTRFQLQGEHASTGKAILLQLGFYSGVLSILLVSFAYFFRVSRDFFKNVFSKLVIPVYGISSFIPFDSLDEVTTQLPARTYISERCRICRNGASGKQPKLLMKAVMQRHHRNVIFATFIAYAILLILGAYINNPYLRVPAGASFLLLFSIFLGLVGAFKYFLKSWEALGWLAFAMFFSVLVKYKVFDLRSKAYGLDYHTTQQPVYHYNTLRDIFTPERYNNDVQAEEQRLTAWKKKLPVPDSSKPPLVVVTVSGGGSRAAYWSFRALQYADSVSGGKLFRNTVLVTGASGGMMGAAYWRNIHDAVALGKLKYLYSPTYQQNIGKDLLNAIVFSFASIDMISPFNKISISGYKYGIDRGYAMEQEMSRNTDSLLGQPMSYYSGREADAQIPMLLINGTIVNDGRKLMICNRPVAYLTQPEYALRYSNPPIDAVDFMALFAGQNAQNLTLTSALRMNATFPYILPVVRLPSEPAMNIMDAGMRDNFGTQVGGRYLFALRDWLENNVGNVIFLQIRDTRENDVGAIEKQSTLGEMLAGPLFVIHNKWEAFQSHENGYVKDYIPYCFGSKFKIVTLQYVPKEFSKTAALNFHLTQDEKEDLYQSINNPYNQGELKRLLDALK